MLRAALLVATCLLSGPTSASAAPAPDDALADEARAVLARCLACHGPDAAARQGDLGLHTAARLRGGPDGVVVPGDPAASELLRRVTTSDPRRRMPPPDAGDALSADEVDTLRRWIDHGAPWTRHWAYASWRDVTPPAVDDPDGFVRDDLDRFILERLQSAGLRPSPPADRATLVRRASLDLVGMPPTEAELARVLADPRPDAYERWVDELLASPHHAETWARHWLDLARYADSHGFTIDGGRSMWPWRDQVIRAMERDQPFDAFSIEQLAGDLLPDATREQRLATGFHRNTQVNQEGGAKDEENRLLAVVDRVDTTGAVWLGTTVGCARCHDHKLDPISQREYYELFAFFDSTTDGGVSAGPSLGVPGSDAERAALDEWERERDDLDARVTELEQQAAGDAVTWQPPRAVTSNGAELRPLEDGSFRSLGQNPEYSVYTFEGVLPATLGVLRLEALPDVGLPAGGPGRAGNGNAVLQELRLAVRADDGTWTPRALTAAAADFEQDTRADGGGHYPASALVDGDPRTGWAFKPRLGAPHVAAARLAEPIPAGRVLRLEIVQEHGGQHVLGRVRLGLAPASSTLDVLTQIDPAWSDAWRARREHEHARPRLPSSLVLERRAEPRTTRVFVRGDPLRPGEVVRPGVPAALDRVGLDGALRTRLDLARWLVHPDNALTWRVTANRWWQQLFGIGLVETEADFGQGGERPSHPDLLEWLARHLVQDGFSRRAFLRRVVTSGTYMQAATPRAELLPVDPRNRLLARQSTPRLTAEALRDSALRASGLLDPTRFGPPVQPPQPDGVYAFTQSAKTWTPSQGGDRHRRTLYTRLWRSSPHPFLTTFDLPSPTVTCTRRTRSTTPLQALTLANDPMILELADSLGERARAVGGDDAALGLAFTACLSREPSAAERARLREHLDTVRALRRAEGLDESDVEAAAWTSVARVLFNLPEFQVRP